MRLDIPQVRRHHERMSPTQPTRLTLSNDVRTALEQLADELHRIGGVLEDEGFTGTIALAELKQRCDNIEAELMQLRMQIRPA